MARHLSIVFIGPPYCTERSSPESSFAYLVALPISWELVDLGSKSCRQAAEWLVKRTRYGFSPIFRDFSYS